MDNRITWIVQRAIGVVLLLSIVDGNAWAIQAADSSAQMVDDFEQYDDGDLPARWKVIHNKKLVPIAPRFMRPDEEFFVVENDGNNVLRAYSNGEAVHIMMENGDDGFDWDIEQQPRLEWEWRAHELPVEAREDVERLNDSGAALYVIFKMEGLIIKRPKTIKYVYSSSLPVGTVVSYGKLKVIVAASALDGTGDWVRISRNVEDDYRDVFGDDPPRRPLSIRLWSDSDNTESPARVDFDNIRLLSVD